MSLNSKTGLGKIQMSYPLASIVARYIVDTWMFVGNWMGLNANMQETLFIPVGYGKGTIVYDKDKNPYLVGKSIGGSLHEISQITQEEAKTRIDQGSKVLTSQEN